MKDVAAMTSEITRLHEQVKTLQQCNNREVDKRRAAEDKYDDLLGSQRDISCLSDLCDLYGVEADEDKLARAIYKATQCGAWFKVTGQWRERVEIGSIVEGSDEEVEPHDLAFPFKVGEWRQAIQDIEDEADRIWKEVNEDGEDT